MCPIELDDCRDCPSTHPDRKATTSTWRSGRWAVSVRSTPFRHTLVGRASPGQAPRAPLDEVQPQDSPSMFHDSSSGSPPARRASSCWSAFRPSSPDISDLWWNATRRLLVPRRAGILFPGVAIEYRPNPQASARAPERLSPTLRHPRADRLHSWQAGCGPSCPSA
jgi:hypothetical protein